jgi:predicted RNase H-like HicB family nuclease
MKITYWKKSTIKFLNQKNSSLKWNSNLIKMSSLLLLMFIHFTGFSEDFNGKWTSVTPSNNCKSSISNYTIIAENPKSTVQESSVPLGNKIYITFPSGFNLGTITGGSVNGTAISSSISKGSTTVSFETPVAISKNSVVTIVLNNVTNKNTSGNYQLSMAIDNNTGTGTGFQNLFAADVSSQYTIITKPLAPTSAQAGDISCNLFVANWSSVTQATSYILDVATDPDFTSILADYTALNVGQNTSYTIENLYPGTNYYYRISASNLCGYSDFSATQMATTLDNPVPVIIASGTLSFCEGDSVTLDAGLWEDYLWSNDETSREITIYTSGIYYVTVKDSKGCMGISKSVEVIVNVTEVNLGPDVTVCGGCVILDAGNEGASYNWSTGEEYQTIKVCTSGTYYVNVSDLNGCKGTDTIMVTINPVPVVNLGADINAAAGTIVTLDAGNEGSTFLWSTSETTQTISVSAAGTYYVLVTNEFGCYEVDSIKVHYTLSNLELSSELKDLKVFPNPVNGNLNVNFRIQKEDDVQLKIFNYTGAIVYSENTVSHSGEYNKNIDLSAMTPGIYFLQVVQNGQSQTVKIIRTK